MPTPATCARWSAPAIGVLCFGVAAYAVGLYGFGPGAERLHPEMRATFEREALAIRTHIFASALALVLGPFQFSARLRARRPDVHRWLGRLYLGGAVVVGGMAGLYMSVHAFGGVVAKLGFAGLALGWLYTGVQAYLAVRRRDFVEHRRWMVRNFALTLAAVTLRLYLPPVFIFGLPFAQAYAVIAWACWVPNWMLAEWWLERSAPRPALA